ncbi:hypothetical protein JD844_024447 [Phrynosoma platyrhinos]|uniref:RING-type domain-containing protein n=1 Tax=Phrynosoma platyrhinos TaxID=52577 RepID=A0ABQ7SY98_PHRPL|nr:hypothetical protein JD844_024447 [Phrynosoma platyrhinos]
MLSVLRIKIHIQRTEGCDHMTCSQCNTNFCYRCGERYRQLRFFGDHTSNLSIFGCKYRYLPERPHLRRLVRGSVCGEYSDIGNDLWEVADCTIDTGFGTSNRSHSCYNSKQKMRMGGGGNVGKVDSLFLTYCRVPPPSSSVEEEDIGKITLLN